MAELKKCPFCGGEAKIVIKDWDNRADEYKVMCSKCGAAREDYYFNEESAIRLWNNRATEAEIRAKAEHTYENCHNITCRRKCQKDGYNIAIDEFAEKLRRNFRDIGAFTGYEVKREIDEIAEQLKEE